MTDTAAPSIEPSIEPTIEPSTAPSAAPTTSVIGLYQAVMNGDLTAAGSFLTDDAVLHVPGHQPLSGDHVGRQAVFVMVAASSTLADRWERIELVDLLTGTTHVAAYCLVTGSRDGRDELENRTVHLFRIAADGRIAEAWFHNWDQDAVDRFWS